ncbi:MAG: hypothetical protein RLZZ455_1238 [Candidatus Parcubacteria bacterium]|jgi:hypothetical protein
MLHCVKLNSSFAHVFFDKPIIVGDIKPENCKQITCKCKCGRVKDDHGSGIAEISEKIYRERQKRDEDEKNDIEPEKGLIESSDEIEDGVVSEPVVPDDEE